MFSRKLKTTWMIRKFGLLKVPLIWLCRPKVIEHTDERIEVVIRKASNEEPFREYVFWCVGDRRRRYGRIPCNGSD